MDICTYVCVLLIVYFSVCLAILCLGDSDIVTFLSCYIGKNPVEAFNGKVVWITGASSGIGEGIAKELSKCTESKIVLSARRKEELERVKKECLELNPKKNEDSILIVAFDMTDYSSHGPSLSKIIQKFGKLDVLISNAGRSQRAPWHEIEIEVDKELFELNVFSLLNLNRIVLRHYMEQGFGQLAVMSSIAGKIGAPVSGSYTGSKFALHGYFESLRNELRSNNIKIAMLCPGPVFSGVLREAFTAHKGEKIGEDHSPSDRRMTAARCGYLSLVAIANEIDEGWFAPFPIVPLTYVSAYQPYLFSRAVNFINKSGAFSKLRDGKEVVKKSE